MLRSVFVIVAALLLGMSAAQGAQRVALGRAVVLLTGPWRFHTGDNPAWQNPSFDDSSWESVDLTPAVGAHDNDVGLANYVVGWAARGHKDYKGFAWYRLEIEASAPQGATLALVAPADVDSAYQIYFNGSLIGSDGDLSQTPPSVISIQPHLFALPRADWIDANGGSRGVLAIRVWCRGAAPPDGGGIHIAPFLGTSEGANAQYRMQWIEKFDGYIVDATEGVAFLLLAIMALSLIPFGRSDSFYLWLAADLILLGLVRGNQAIYFWSQHETLTGYIVLRYVVGDPLLLALSVMTWRAGFDLRRERWTAVATLALCAICMAGKVVSLSMLATYVPHGLAVIGNQALIWGRVAFVLLFGWIFLRGALDRGASEWLAMLAMILLAIGLFATELGELGAPGIWFPFGVGVSRTEYAYAAFDIVLFAYLLQRLWRYAARPRTAMLRAESRF